MGVTSLLHLAHVVVHILGAGSNALVTDGGGEVPCAVVVEAAFGVVAAELARGLACFALGQVERGVATVAAAEPLGLRVPSLSRRDKCGPDFERRGTLDTDNLRHGLCARVLIHIQVRQEMDMTKREAAYRIAGRGSAARGVGEAVGGLEAINGRPCDTTVRT